METLKTTVLAVIACLTLTLTGCNTSRPVDELQISELERCETNDCKLYGLCYRKKESTGCFARGDSCRNPMTLLCNLYGQCAVVDGACQATTEAKCKTSDACKYVNRCRLGMRGSSVACVK